MKAQTQQSFRVWGMGDWASYYGKPEKLDPQVEEILMSPCPFHKGKLVADTHFAFMGTPDINGDPLTVAKWLELHPANGQPRLRFDDDLRPAGQPRTDVAVLEPRLYIVLREIVPGSTDKTPKHQLALLPPEYEVPSTITEVTKSILVFRKTGKRCNSFVWARCSEKFEKVMKTTGISDGRISCVGLFNERGLFISDWGGDCHSHVGIGASRKFPAAQQS